MFAGAHGGCDDFSEQFPRKFFSFLDYFADFLLQMEAVSDSLKVLTDGQSTILEQLSNLSARVSELENANDHAEGLQPVDVTKSVMDISQGELANLVRSVVQSSVLSGTQSSDISASGSYGHGMQHRQEAAAGLLKMQDNEHKGRKSELHQEYPPPPSNETGRL